MRESIYERENLKNVVSVVKHLDRVQIFLNIRKSTLERNLTKVVLCVKVFTPFASLTKHQKILNRNIINLIYVAMLLFKAQALEIIKEFK